MSSVLRPESVVDGRFALEAEARRGGMGTVWRARDLHVSHRALQGDIPYLAMQWLEGDTLAERLARAPLTLDETLSMLRPALEGLAFAHRRGVVHGDLKPSNLFLRRGQVAQVLLLDLGLARQGGNSALTRTGSVLGTPSYMAPEQAQGERDIGSAADVFSLGVLFECLTGRRRSRARTWWRCWRRCCSSRRRACASCTRSCRRAWSCCWSACCTRTRGSARRRRGRCCASWMAWARSRACLHPGPRRAAATPSRSWSAWCWSTTPRRRLAALARELGLPAA